MKMDMWRFKKQVHMHSTWPMTIHEIDPSELSVQTYHINELDPTSIEYLFGNMDDLQAEFADQQSIPLTTPSNSSNYYNDLQERQAYSQPSRYYMNYMAYQSNPYATNSYDNYANNIRQVYGGANTQSDDEKDDEPDSTTKSSKKKRRRRKHPKTPAEQLPPSSSVVVPTQDEEKEVISEKPVEQPENDEPNSTKTKRKRRRIRKAKKSITPEDPQPSIGLKQSEANLLSSSADEKTNDDVVPSSQPPTQHAEPTEKQQVMLAESHMQDVTNVVKNEEKEQEEEEKEFQPTKFSARTANVPPTTSTPIPSVTVVDDEKTADENEKLTHPLIHAASIPTIPIIHVNNEAVEQHVAEDELDPQQQPLANPIQVNISHLRF